MPNLTIKTQDDRELQISRGSFIFLRDEEGEVNWEWEQLLPEIRQELEGILDRSEAMITDVKSLLPNIPMGRLK
jgi:hypothetical protein